MKYIIEVQNLIRVDEDKEEYIHFGYINMIFKFLYETKSYIKKNNKHLRINGNRRSGFYTTTDQLTKMRFLTKIYRNERLNLPPF